MSRTYYVKLKNYEERYNKKGSWSLCICTILDSNYIISYVLCDPKVLSSPLYDVAKEVRPDKSS
jgi:hypothetical protein